ncbi:hypothetical protein HDZ31DRAFT_76690, partial [Schizophyllum fasciatum]
GLKIYSIETFHRSWLYSYSLKAVPWQALEERYFSNPQTCAYGSAQYCSPTLVPPEAYGIGDYPASSSMAGANEPREHDLESARWSSPKREQHQRLSSEGDTAGCVDVEPHSSPEELYQDIWGPTNKAIGLSDDVPRTRMDVDEISECVQANTNKCGQSSDACQSGDNAPEGRGNAMDAGRHERIDVQMAKPAEVAVVSRTTDGSNNSAPSILKPNAKDFNSGWRRYGPQGKDICNYIPYFDDSPKI